MDPQIEATIAAIEPGDRRAMAAARRRWDAVGKPLGSLGLLEDAVVRLAGVLGTDRVELGRKAIVVLCADNGVVAEGVTQTGQEITALVARNLAAGVSVVCPMARVAGAEVIPVDLGMAAPVEVPHLLQRAVRRGTGNMAVGPAMGRAEAEAAVCAGIRLAEELADQGYGLLAGGEMGIGNTTTTAAVTAVLLGRDPAQVTGRGAGLSEAGLTRKVEVIRRALQVNRPDPADPLDVLAKVGGLDLAGLTGLYLGAARRHVPVLLDGVITNAAALLAVRLCPAVRDTLLASHTSGEPAGALLLQELGLQPMLQAGLRLGEGTGAAAVMPLLDMALAVYRDGLTFEEIAMEAYRPLE